MKLYLNTNHTNKTTTTTTTGRRVLFILTEWDFNAKWDDEHSSNNANSAVVRISLLLTFPAKP